MTCPSDGHFLPVSQDTLLSSHHRQQQTLWSFPGLLGRCNGRGGKRAILACGQDTQLSEPSEGWPH